MAATSDTHQRKHFSKVTTTVAWICVASAGWGQAPDPCTRWLGKQCLDSPPAITQASPNVRDEKSVLYTLKPSPPSGTGFTIFKNGSELKAGQDYEIDGSNLIFRSSQAPVKDDVVQSFFFEKIPREATTSSVESVRPSVSQSGYVSNGISPQLVRHALDSELGHVASARDDQMGRGTKSTSNLERSSIQMLTRSIVRHRPRRHDDLSAEPHGEGTADGVEGLGDEPPLSPFTLDRSETAVQSLLQQTTRSSRVNRSSPGTSSTPDSVRMLARILGDCPDNSKACE